MIKTIYPYDVAYTACNKNYTYQQMRKEDTYMLLSYGCLPQLYLIFPPHSFQKAFQSVSYHTPGDNCHGTHTTSLQRRPSSVRLISRSSTHTMLV